MASVEEFQAAGRILFSFGLVTGAEGNLSVFRAGTLWITRTGARLDGLVDGDVLWGGLNGDLPGASSDLEVHRDTYRAKGPGAVAHCHQPGTVGDGGGGPGEHGLYTFGASLEEAVTTAVKVARGARARP